MKKIDINKIQHVKKEAVSGSAKKLIIMMHGLGSDCNDLISLAPYMQQKLQDHHFISINGIEAFDMAPFGRQWFSLMKRDPQIVFNAMQKNAESIEEIINAFQQEYKMENKDTILLGFSQGTMAASYLALSSSIAYAGLIGFSGRLIPPTNIANKNSKFCLIHGDCDDVVPHAESINAQKYLKDKNIENELLIVKNLQHSIDHSGLDFAIDFIKNKC